MIAEQKVRNILVIAFALLLAKPCFAAEDTTKTNFHISASVFLNSNIYSSNFSDLPGFESCCTNYNSALGFAPAFGVGIEYNFPKEFLGLNYSYALRLLYSDISAEYSIDEHIGNNITGNTFQKIISNFILDANIKTLAIENSLIVSPKLGIPIDFNTGFQIALPIAKDIFKVEKLKSPANLTYTDTGTRERKKQSGELIDASSALFSLMLGARYKAYQFDDFALYPEVQFSLGLSNIVSSRDWKSSTARAGVSLSYNLPKKEIVPIVPPVNPPMPQPELPKVTDFDFVQKYVYADVELRDSMEIPIPLFKTYVIDYTIIPPQLYFKKGTDEFNHSYQANTEFGKGIDISAIVSRFFNENGKKVVITINTLSNEPDALFEKRKKKITDLIVEAGGRIDLHYIFEHNKIDVTKLNKNITDEFVSASIRNEDNVHLLFRSSITKSESEKSSNRNVVFFEATIPDGFELNEYKLSCIYEGKELYSTFNLKGRINLIDDYYLHNGTNKTNMKVFSSAKLKDGRTKNKEFTIVLAPYFANATTIMNNESGKEMFLFSLFDFNSHEVKYFDRHIFNKAYEITSKGKRIRIIPFTDNIGGKDYNIKLAERRAEAAIELLKLKPEQYEIKYPESYLFDNNSPFGRILNRSVIIEYAD